MFNPLPSDSYLWAEFRRDFVEQNFVFFVETSSSSVLVGVVNNSSPTPSNNLTIKREGVTYRKRSNYASLIK